jgi:hypothetical protein
MEFITDLVYIVGKHFQCDSAMKLQHDSALKLHVALRKVFSSIDFPKPAVHQRFGMPCNYVAFKLKKLQ